MKPYEKDLYEIIEKYKNEKPTLLLHSCCAPCSTQVIDFLYKYFYLTVFFYNPNIYPLDEYEKRKNNQITLIEKLKSEGKKIKYIDGDYDSDLFEQIALGYENEKEGGERCSRCFELRLQKTAELANKLNFNFFSTTLTVSPHKNSELIEKIGRNFDDKSKFFFYDFKKKDGYKKSIEFSKKYNLYRQNYCGCRYSFKMGEN